MNDNNFYVVHGWMLSKLKLKNKELNVFAIIYGFSQDGENVYNGGLSYLEEWTCSSKKTVIEILKKLVGKKYLIKTTKVINNITFNEYKANIDFINDMCKNYTSGVKITPTQCKNYTTPSVKITPNNINNNINNNITTTNQEENLPEKNNLEETVNEKNSSSSLIDFNFLKTYSGISDATRHNILKIKPDMTKQEFEQKFQTVKNENLKGNIKSFDAVLVKYIKGEWNIEIPVNSDSQVVPGGEVEMKAVKRIVFDCLSYIQFGWSRKDLLDKLNRDTSSKSNFVREKAMEMLVAELDRRGIS